jgi:hypothetical protein
LEFVDANIGALQAIGSLVEANLGVALLSSRLCFPPDLIVVDAVRYDRAREVETSARQGKLDLPECRAGRLKCAA